MIFTIDGDDTKDIDDAISVKKMGTIIYLEFILQMFQTMLKLELPFMIVHFLAEHQVI